MKRTHITAGTKIDTISGYIIVKSINDAGLCYCDEYTIDDDELDVFAKTETRLMPADIARLMKEVDGLNHEVIAVR